LIPKLREYGIIEKDVFGMTPDLDLDHLPMRPREILQWIRDNTAICPWRKNLHAPNITQFVVLDDRSIVNEHYGHTFRGRFVKTNGSIGLTSEIASNVIRVWNQSSKLCDLSTWALNNWKVFDEFDHTTYNPVGPYSIQIVHTRTATSLLPLHFLKKSILRNYCHFLVLKI